MRKSQIEKKVRDILSKDYDPLKTAVKYEIEYYEHNYSELKRVHRKNLEDLLRIFTESLQWYLQHTKEPINV